MNQSNGNARGLNGLLEGKATLDQQINQSMNETQNALKVLKISMQFKSDLDQALGKFNSSMAELNKPKKVVIEDDGPTVSEIIAEYESKKNGAK